MALGFLNVAVLAGLAGLAIPPIIHFFSRRRHDVIDWGAMQFLEISTARCRKFFLEELLLLLARMAMVALLVFMLAKPIVQGPLADRVYRPSRDVVYVLDCSASMSVSSGDTSPWKRACDAIRSELNESGDRAAILLAGRPAMIAAPLGADRDELLRFLDESLQPAGGIDGPACVEAAWEHLRQHGRHAEREIVLVTDQQLAGWFDAEAQAKWRQWADRLESSKASPEGALPRIRWIALKPAELEPTNFALDRITASRRLAGVRQKVAFASAAVRHGTAAKGPQSVVFEIDGKRVAESKMEAGSARSDVRFEHRFDRSGIYLVTMRFGSSSDVMAADDRQDLVFEVLPELPVLLVDGENPNSPASTTFFLRKAFAEPGDKTRTSVVAASTVSADLLTRKAILPTEGTKPRVVVLSDLPSLTREQSDLLQTFVKEGGGLLVLAGPRMASSKGGDNVSWLSAEVVGAGAAPANEPANARLDAASFFHPALKLFEEQPGGSLSATPHRHWSKLRAERGDVVARLTNGDPWLAAKKLGKGQVLVSALPMDSSWEGVLAKSWEFPVLVHELVFALADIRSDAFNLEPGQPIVLEEAQALEAAVAMLHTPSGKVVPWRQHSRGSFPAPGFAGTYRLAIDGGETYPIVVRSDLRESLLTYASEDDVKQLEELVPARWATRAEQGSVGAMHDAWLLFLGMFLTFLCWESWLTRRLARSRSTV